jgi:hypothetical protein
MKTFKRVRLEPELEIIAGEWSGEKRIAMGLKFLRWGWQLVLTGRIISSDARRVVRPRALRLLAGFENNSEKVLTDFNSRIILLTCCGQHIRKTRVKQYG